MRSAKGSNEVARYFGIDGDRLREIGAH
jgi:hypothetical protein